MPQNIRNFHSIKVKKISRTMNHFADVVFCEVLTCIFIKCCGHQSSNWFENSLILSSIPNDLDKNNPKNILFDSQ